jgi:hypothetical protein
MAINQFPEPFFFGPALPCNFETAELALDTNPQKPDREASRRLF